MIDNSATPALSGRSERSPLMTRSILMLMLAALAAFATSCSRAVSEERPAAAPVPVHVATVAHEAVALPVTATGTLAPKDAADLSFKVGGVVARVLVAEGDRVRAGQVLAALEQGDVEPAVARARAAAEKAERDHQRLVRLHAEGVVSLAQLEDAATALESARAEYERARFDRRHATILAPSAGVVLRRFVEPGEVVSAGRPVIGFGGNARGQVVQVGLADRDFVRIAKGDLATVRFDAYPERAFAGVVTERAAAADAATGTYRVEIAVRDAAALASGLVGRIEIRPRATGTVALVPVASVLEADGERATVYVLSADGRRAERRAVRLAFLVGERAAVASGLEGAERVITEGAPRLADGQGVEVLR